MNNQLQGTLFIGFPKSMTFNQADGLFDELSDYIDNNSEVTLDILKADKDYTHLVFQQTMPTLIEKSNHFYMEMEIYISKISNVEPSEISEENNLTNLLNILSVDFGDVCETLHNNGFIYNDNQDYWFKPSQDSE